jgi:hypothetical protein
MKTIKTGTASREHIQGLQGEQPLPCSLVAARISESEIPREHVSDQLSSLLHYNKRKKTTKKHHN